MNRICNLDRKPAYVEEMNAPEHVKNIARNIHNSLAENLLLVKDQYGRHLFKAVDANIIPNDIDFAENYLKTLNKDYNNAIKLHDGRIFINASAIASDKRYNDSVDPMFNSGSYFNLQDHYDLEKEYDRREKMIAFAKMLGVDVSAVESSLEIYGANAVTDLFAKTIKYVSGEESKIPEEVATLFLMLLPKNHPLYNDIMDGITSQPGYQKVFNDYKKDKLYQLEDGSPNVDKINKEVATKLIAQKLLPQSFIKRLINWFRALFNGTLRANGAAAEMASKILKGDVSDLSFDNIKDLTEADGIFFNKTVFQDIDDKINNGKAEEFLEKLLNIQEALLKTSKNVTDKNVKNQLFNIIRRIEAAETESDAVSLAAIYANIIISAKAMLSSYKDELATIMDIQNNDERLVKLYTVLKSTRNVMEFIPELTDLHVMLNNDSFMKKELDQLLSDESVIESMYKNVIFKTLSPFFVKRNLTAYESAKALHEAEIQKLEEKLKNTNDPYMIKGIKLEIERRNKMFKQIPISEENINGFLNGTMGDSKAYQFWLEAAIMNDNPIISDLAAMAMEDMTQISQELNDMLIEVKQKHDQFVKDRGVSVNNDEKLYENIYEVVKEFSHFDENGNVVTKDKLYLVSKQKHDHVLEYQTLRAKARKLSREIAETADVNKKFELQKELNEISKQREAFVRKTYENKYTDEYLANEDLLNTVIDEENNITVADKVKDIYGSINMIEETLSFTTDNDMIMDLVEELDSLNMRLREMKSIVNKDENTPEYKMAIILQTYSEKKAEMVKYKETEASKQRVKILLEDLENKLKSGVLSQENYQTLKNQIVRVGLSETYLDAIDAQRKLYNETVNSIIELMEQYVSLNPDKVNPEQEEALKTIKDAVNVNLNDLYKERAKFLAIYKDENGVVDGTEVGITSDDIKKLKDLQKDPVANATKISDLQDKIADAKKKAAAKVKELDEKIEKKQNQTVRIKDGLTKEESRRKKELEESVIMARVTGMGATQQEIDEYEELEKKQGAHYGLMMKSLEFFDQKNLLDDLEIYSNTITIPRKTTSYYDQVREREKEASIDLSNLKIGDTFEFQGKTYIYSDKSGDTLKFFTPEVKDKVAEMQEQINKLTVEKRNYEADIKEISDKIDLLYQSNVPDAEEQEKEYKKEIEAIEDKITIINSRGSKLIEQANKLVEGNFITSDRIKEAYLMDTQWFKDNHYAKEKWDQDDYGYYTSYEPLSMWTEQDLSEIKDEYIQEYARQKYQERIVEPEFLNKNYEEGRMKLKPGVDINDKYDTLSKTEKDYLEFLREKQHALKEAIGDTISSLDKLDMHEKDSFEKMDLSVQGLMNVGKGIARKFKSTEQDEIEGYVSKDVDPFDEISVFSDRDMDVNLASKDVTKMVLYYAKRAVKKKVFGKSKMIADLALKQSQQTSYTKKANATVSKLKQGLSKVAPFKFKNRVTSVVPGEAAQTTKFLREWINKVYHNQNAYDEYLGNWNIGKSLDTLTGLAAKSILGLRLTAPIGNFLSSEIQMQLQVVRNRGFYTERSIAKAHMLATSLMKDLFKDYSMGADMSLIGQLLTKFDAYQGKFVNSFGQQIDFSLARQASNFGEIITANKNFFEFYLQTIQAIAVLENMTVVTKKGNKISLFEAYELGPDGKIKLKDNVEVPDAQIKEAVSKIQYANLVVNGNFNSINQPMGSKYVAMRSTLFLSKHLVPFFMERFKKPTFNRLTNDFEGGFYTVFATRLYEDIRNKQFNFIKNWSLYSDKERKAFQAVLVDSLVIGSLGLLYSLAGGKDPDKYKKFKKGDYGYWRAQYLNMLLKVNIETQAMHPMFGFDNMIQKGTNPFPLMTTVKTVTKLILQLDPTRDHRYKINTGIHKKGDLKSVALIYKLIGTEGLLFDAVFPAERLKLTEQSQQLRN